MKKIKLTVGITGASGAIYGHLLLKRLEALKDQLESCDLVFSKNAKAVWNYEIGALPELPDVFHRYDPDDLFAPMASGSAGFDAMIIAPCTMGTLGRIASGVSSDLITRAADVILKERKKLILVPREMPYSLIHLSNMKFLTEAGAIICPAAPSFYSRPTTIDELATTVVDKILGLAGFETDSFRWGEKDGI
jgi:flavin prenyltransferase